MQQPEKMNFIIVGVNVLLDFLLPQLACLLACFKERYVFGASTALSHHRCHLFSNVVLASDF